MTDRPIIFNGAMVCALCDGRKTQTRRVLKWSPAPVRSLTFCEVKERTAIFRSHLDAVTRHFPIPYAIGDRLWVKEAHWLAGYWEKYDTGEPLYIGAKVSKIRRRFVAAENQDAQFDIPKGSYIKGMPIGVRGLYKRLGRYMFRKHSRLTLTVTDVRVQQVQDISHDDAVAEGATDVFRALPNNAGATGFFREIWNSIHGPDAWDRNDWVAAYTFTVHKGNIDHA